jgi:hypothetical protein
MNYPTPVQAMTVTNYDMFTDEGNYMVGRIVEAGRKLRMSDTDEQVWAWTQHELRKLATADEFGEATDTAVRERVYTKLGVDIH